MPQEVVHHITQIGRAQGMPSRIMYTNQRGDEISDRLEDFFDDSDTDSTESEDETYVTGADSDDLSVSDDETTSTSNDDDDDPHDDHDMPDPEAPDHAALLSPGDGEDDLEDNDGEPPAADTNEEHIPVPDTTEGAVTVTVDYQEDDSSEATEGAATATNDCLDDDSSDGTPFEPPMTEHDRFMAAEKAVRVASDRQVSGRRVSTRTKTPARHYGFLTEQMSAEKGLRQLGRKGTDALMKELQQLIDRRVMHPRDATTLSLSQSEKYSALKTSCS